MAEGKLSADARYLGHALFGPMLPGIGKVTFQQTTTTPSPRTQAALDELVAAGLLSVEPFNRYGGLVYRPLVTFPRAKEPPGDWPITVPIDAGRAALREPTP